MSRRLSAGEVCTRNVTYAYKSMAVNEAARLMREQHVGSLVVVEETEQGRIAVGMLQRRAFGRHEHRLDLGALIGPVTDEERREPAQIHDSRADATLLQPPGDAKRHR